ncbi:PH domain-containing protein [Mucilaginibacter sp. CSA2-8R]|uniref:PH domain-containing protein n=1 Tax=Mucilaginibacter sp. CSA2-8R TaxID=3141542 RepID=UPI00315DB67E
MNTPRRYPSAVSFVNYVPLLYISGIGLFVGFCCDGFMTAGLLLAGVAVLTLPILLNTTYTIDGEMLKIRSGFIKYEDINIASITRIEKTQLYRQAPALSKANRILISYNRYDSIVISPKNRSAFIADILRINPGVTVGSGV